MTGFDEIVKSEALAPIVALALSSLAGLAVWFIKFHFGEMRSRIARLEEVQARHIEFVNVIAAKVNACPIAQVTSDLSEIKERTTRITTMSGNMRMKIESLEKTCAAVDDRHRGVDARLTRLEARDELREGPR